MRSGTDGGQGGLASGFSGFEVKALEVTNGVDLMFFILIILRLFS